MRKRGNSKGKLEKALIEKFAYLNFDYEEAARLALDLRQQRLTNPEINYFAKRRYIDKKGNKRVKKLSKEKDAYIQFNYDIELIDRWSDKIYDAKRDQVGLRLHTPLTNLPKNYRQFITYGLNKETLVGLDLKNSQPFFSLAIMNPAFWYYDDMPKKDKSYFRRYFKHVTTPLDVNIKTIGFENLFSRPHLKNIYKALRDLKADADNYKTFITTGTFYEEVGKLYEQSDIELPFELTRANIKTSLFTTFYSENRFISQKEAVLKKLFSQAFPSVYALFKAVKTNTSEFVRTEIVDKPYKILSIMLQRIESYAMLDIVCNKIMTDYPSVPLYTIHDSLCTTEQNVPLIKSILVDIINSSLGVSPNIDEQPFKT